MRFLTTLILLLGSIQIQAQQATVDIALHPAGSFQIKSGEVHGLATQAGDKVSAKNITVGLKNVQTGIGLRDSHTKKHLEVEQYPEATLVSAEGSAGKGKGLLKVRNITKPIEGTYQINGSTLTAKFAIKLSDFKFENLKYMGIGVDDNATLVVQVPMVK